MVKIKDLPLSERPRERLIQFGVEHLSNEDILAILFKTGTKNMSVKELSSQVLASVSNISDLKMKRYQEFIQVKGIGETKACVLLAAIELGKRIYFGQEKIQNQKFQNAEFVYQYYRGILQDKTQEYFYCIYLDHRKIVLEEKLLFIGTLNQSIVHPREIFKEAYLLNASGIICLHNHPSGNVLPSIEDKNVTKRLAQIGTLMGIHVVDHIIVGKNQYYSFFENGDIV